MLEVHVLELPKLPKNADGTEIWDWMKFISADKKEELDMIAQKNPRVKKAVARLMELSQDERTRMLYESRRLMEMDQRVSECDAKQEGKQEERLTIAKNALHMSMPLEDIVKLTGLPKDKIEELQN